MRATAWQLIFGSKIADTRPLKKERKLLPRASRLMSLHKFKIYWMNIYRDFALQAEVKYQGNVLFYIGETFIVSDSIKCAFLG